MSRTSYWPGGKAEQVAWLNQFNAAVAPTPTLYGVTAAQMSAFNELLETVNLKWAATQDPATRTKIAIADRDDAINAARVMARDLVSIIQGTPTCTDGQKIAAGVTVRKTNPTPAPVPGKAKAEVRRLVGRTATIDLGLAGTGPEQRRAKPAGADFAQLYYAFGDAPPATPEGWTFATATGRTTAEIDFGSSATGDTVWITAAWVNTRKESGPAATPVSVQLPASAPVPQAIEEGRPMRVAA